VSGLVVDQLGGTLVCSVSAAWVHRRRALVEEALAEATGRPAGDIVWRPAEALLRQEGLSDSEIAGSFLGQVTVAASTLASVDGASGDEGWDGEGEGGAGGPGAAPGGDGPESALDEMLDGGAGYGGDAAGEEEVVGPRVAVRESGIEYWAEPYGQKTGFYADQRESRLFVRSIARGKRVLDLCCYSGGFSLNAAVGGATAITGVDSSASAVTLATANAALNYARFAPGCSVTFAKADIEAFMADALARGEQWDLVVLDPPKLAPTRKDLPRAERKYARLNAQAARLVAPGGVLMTCSCSGAMTQSGGFERVAASAVEREGRTPVVGRRAGAAPCHAANPWYPEGNYLTNLTMVLD